MKVICIAVVLATAVAIAAANGRPPMTNGVFFKPGDVSAIYVATTFGVLVSPDGCHFYWLCEQDVGFGGQFDPGYAVTPAGTILATTFHGLRVSRDGGCSFTTATSELPASDPNNLSLRYIDTVALGPTGDVWVGTADTGSNNGVFRSLDDAVSFEPRGTLPGTMAWRSIEIAPSDARRAYVTGFQYSGNMMPPSGHWYRSDDAGATWSELSLSGVVLGSSPELRVVAIDPEHPDVAFVIAINAKPPSGDRLYRTSDGGGQLVEVLATTHPITGVVARGSGAVIVATQYDGAFASTDGGISFAPMAGAPQLACIGQRGDGSLFGCAQNYDPDHMAVARFDGATWINVARFEYLTGPLECPPGTVEHETCDSQLWRGVAEQLGVMPAECAAGPDLGADASDQQPPPKRGCCDSGSGAGPEPLAAVIVLVVRRRWRARPAARR